MWYTTVLYGTIPVFELYDTTVIFNPSLSGMRHYCMVKIPIYKLYDTTVRHNLNLWGIRHYCTLQSLFMRYTTLLYGTIPVYLLYDTNVGTIPVYELYDATVR